MRDSKRKSNVSSQDDVIDLNAILIVVAKLVVVLLGMIICLRLPFIWIKLPAAAGVAYLGWRWISGVKKPKPVASPHANSFESGRKGAGRQKQQSTIERYEAAFDRAAKPDQNVVRLLVAYDAAGEFGKVKTLIQRLDGEEFSEPVAKELSVLAGNYFPIELETTETGVRFKLA
jgi:hypothetical protein